LGTDECSSAEILTGLEVGKKVNNAEKRNSLPQQQTVAVLYTYNECSGENPTHQFLCTD